MKNKPLLINVIAAFYLLTPVFFILQYFAFLHRPFTDLQTWKLIFHPPFYKLTFIIIPPIVAVGIYRVRLWGWYLAIAHLLYVLGNNLLAFLVGRTVTPWWVVGLNTVVTLAVIVFFVRRVIRAPYFNPRVRWWESKPRYAVTLKVKLKNERAQIEGETFNISLGGLFMVSNAAVGIDEPFELVLTRNGDAPADVACKGRVVWINPQGQKLPQGFGVMFTKVERPALDFISAYIVEQKKVLKENVEVR